MPARSQSRNLLLSAACLTTAYGIACSDSLFGDGNRRDYTDEPEAGVVIPTTGAVGESEALFRAIEPELVAQCGGGSGACHLSGDYPGNPPPFLKGPDSYRSIKATPGIIVADVSTSSILVKGDHAGPALAADLKPRVQEWLTAEARSIDATRPVSDAQAIVIGDNDIDVTSLSSGLADVRLKFTAQLTGTILSLSNVRLGAPAGQAVHVQHLSFTRVPADTNLPETRDPVDSFSNLDINVPGGAESVLPPGNVFFAGWAWAPEDKMRIQITKLEPGMLSEAGTTAACANPAGFGTMVAPQLNSCLGCHGQNGNVQGALDLSGLQRNPADFADTCAKVLNKVDKTTPADSLIVKKNDGRLAHGGGQSAMNGTLLKNAIVAAAQGGVF